MTRRLIIDDKRTFADVDGMETVHVRTVLQARVALTHPWDEVWFDYDMGWAGGGDTMKLARDMEESPGLYDVDRTFIHSGNPVGSIELEWALREFHPTRLSHKEIYSMLSPESDE